MRTPSPIPIALAFTMLVASTAGTVHAQEPTSEDSAARKRHDPIPIRIELVTDTLSKTAQSDIAEAVKRAFAPISRKYGLYHSDEPDLVIRLEFGEADRNAGIYVIHAQATFRGEVLRRDEPRTCVNCTPVDLVADGLQIVAVAAEEVIERQIRAAEELESTEDAPPPPPVDEDAMPRARTVGAAGYVGASSVVFGLGAAIAGTVMLDRGVVKEGYNSSSPFFTVTDYATPGKIWIGTGLGLMVVGTVLLTVDLTVLHARRQARARATIDGFAVTVSDTPGFAVRGRF